MSTEDEIVAQQVLLATYRQTLAHYLRQQAMQGEAFALPVVSSGIREARENISRIKRLLRTWGAEVEDHPDDEPADRRDAETLSPPPLAQPQDWGEAPDVDRFYGRQAELARLERWVVADDCRLVGVFGIGGIGKTALATKLARQVQSQFAYVIWRSLRNAPLLESLLADCLAMFPAQQISGSDDVARKISLLMDALRRHRVLLLFDNVEAIMLGGARVGTYRDGYENYGRLFQQIADGAHQSCLLLTSREKPAEFAGREGESLRVRALQIAGLTHDEGRAILRDRGVSSADGALLDALVDHYSGNPFALQLVSETILQVYGGDVAVFLQEGAIMFGDIRDLLRQQIDRLTPLELEIMYWLAIEREPISAEGLQTDIVRPTTRRDIQDTLNSLRRRLLIESAAGAFTLQNVVMEYMTDLLVDQIYEEFAHDKLALFTSHALIKAQTRDYLRKSQQHLILDPIVERLCRTSGQDGVEEWLKHMLDGLRQARPRQPGYAAGNALNLLVRMQSDISGYDFSGLTVRQAYIRGVNLHDVNFARANLGGSVFTEVFGRVLSVAWSPNGQIIAMGTASREVRLWHAAEDRPFLICEGHEDWVRSVAFSPDGRILASSSYDQTARLWDASNGQCLRVLHGHTARLWSVAFSPDGRILATASEDRTVRLWDVATGQTLLVLRGHDDWVRAVAFSPDGRSLATGSRDRTVRLWEVATGECLTILQGHTEFVHSVAFSPDGRTLASGSNDGTVRLWELATGQCYKLLQWHTDAVWFVAFSPDGRALATGSDDHNVQLWDVGTYEIRKTLIGHTSSVWAIAFSPDGRTLVTGSEDQTLRLWDVETSRCLSTLLGHTNSVWSIAFSPDGRTLVTGSEDQTVQLWDIATGRCNKTLRDHCKWVRSVAFSPDGQRLASGSDDHTVRLWDARTGQVLQTLQGHTWRIWTVAFSPDGHLIASGSSDQTVRLWDARTGECRHTLHGHIDRVWAVAFSPDGRALASGGDDQTVRLWDTSTGQHQRILLVESARIRTVAFSPDGAILACGGSDQQIHLWNVHTGEHLKALAGHTDWIRSVMFHASGELLVSGSEDQTVRLWDVRSGECLRILRGHTSQVRAVAFDPTNNLIASGGSDAAIKLWEAQTGMEIKTLHSDRPYERLNMTGATGLTEAQKATLKALGAFDGADQPPAHT
jgi:WD40 repeat protein